MSSVAQEKFELFKYGDMDSWVTRRIEESSIIGGNVKYLYELGPEMDFDGNIPYKIRVVRHGEILMSWLKWQV